MCSTRGAHTRMRNRKVTRRSRASARPALCHNSSHRRYDWELPDLGASSNANTDKSETPLHLACAQGALDCVSER